MTVDNASKGLATITGIAGLENPRVPDESKPKSILFDAQLWVSGQSRENGQPIVAVFKYYNEYDLPFNPDEVGYYFIHATVAKIVSEPSIYGPGMELHDYSMVGDITSLVPLGDALDARYRPIIHVCGAVTHMDSAKSTFDLAPDQYISLLRNVKGQKVNYPVRVLVKDSPRWGGKKPSPRMGTYVAVHGFLSGISRHETEKTINYFEVELINVVFLGKAPASLLPSVSTPSPDLTTPDKKRKLKLDMSSPCPPRPLKKARLGSDASSSTLGESTTSNLGSTSDIEYVDPK